MERTQPAYEHAIPHPTAASISRPAENGLRGMRLTGLEGGAIGLLYLIQRPELEIGREPDCDIHVPNDPTVSRVHAKITLDGEVHMLQDCGSSNGTFVNGVSIHTCILAPGDVIQVGATKLRYE